MSFLQVRRSLVLADLSKQEGRKSVEYFVRN